MDKKGSYGMITELRQEIEEKQKNHLSNQGKI